MKKIAFTIYGFLIIANSFAQDPTYQEKLFYTCKVWGFMKYYHSRVSTNEINWDSVLVQNLPKIKSAVTNIQFNNAIDNMLRAAGPMELTNTPSPDTLPVELKRNLSFEWIQDKIFSNDIRMKLDTIKNHFRPHAISYAKLTNENRTIKYFLGKKSINTSDQKGYPEENVRLLAFFSFWNYMNYFNPNQYLLDNRWDSTLYHNVVSIASAGNSKELSYAFKKVCTKLDDAHVETSTFNLAGFFIPSVTVRYIQNEYVVINSDIRGIEEGDIIEKVDHKTPLEWEDELRPYISAGNESVFRKLVAIYMLSGSYLSKAHIELKDRSGDNKSRSAFRHHITRFNLIHFPNNTLRDVKWKKLDGNVGYVNMGVLKVSDIDSMYNALKGTSSIIFDLRNYPRHTLWNLAPVLYPNRICFAKLLVPSVTYPGTFTLMNDSLGINGNVNSYKGKVIVLCNQDTQSQAEYTCMVLKAMPNATIIGSQTAGADGNTIQIRFSGDIVFGYSSVGVYYPDGTNTQRVGIVPDITITPTIEGIRNNRDEVLEKALEVAGCSKLARN